MFGKRIVQGGKCIQECDFEIMPPERSWYQRKLMGLGIGLRVVTIAMGTRKNGRISAAISMTSVLIVALIESMHRNLLVVQFGGAVVDGAVMIAKST
jgi:hypothetical protein